MQKTILFIDTTYPKPYDNTTLIEEPLGGTEASVIRTATLLSTEFKVFVLQKSRVEITIVHEHLSYLPIAHLTKLNPNTIVVLRKYPYTVKLRKLFPDVKLYVWLHTYKNREYILKYRSLIRNSIGLITNSSTHKIHLKELFKINILNIDLLWWMKNIEIEYCYNPIPKPEILKIKRDINKLLFLSSPNKGLKEVIDHFVMIKRKLPKLKLYIANPGYKKNDNVQANKDIIDLGSLGKNELMRHIAESLCIFYPQHSFSETFGLIYAEANAYNTPVLAHDIGAAKEILHKNNELTNTYNNDKVYETIVKWRKKLPRVSYNNKFSEKHIFNQWNKLLKG